MQHVLDLGGIDVLAAYVTLRPSFGDKDAIYAYLTEVSWDDGVIVAVLRRRTA
jgi:hypothetical protein